MRINKYPFFLWLTQRRDDFKLDLQNQRIYSDELGSSSIKAVPVYWIILMKYVPVICLSYFFYFPQTENDLLLCFIALIMVGLLIILINFPTFLKLFTITFSLASIYLIINNDSFASQMSIVLTFFMELLLLGAIFYDILVLKGHQNWYFLDDFQQDLNFKLNGKKERNFFFFKKKKFGLEFEKSFSLKGYFLRITQ